jgi:hypothetical protein
VTERDNGLGTRAEYIDTGLVGGVSPPAPNMLLSTLGLLGIPSLLRSLSSLMKDWRRSLFESKFDPEPGPGNKPEAGRPEEEEVEEEAEVEEPKDEVESNRE